VFFSIANVLKPICKLLRNATKLVGPTTVILKSLCKNSKSPVRLRISAYNPSVGTNIIAKSVVIGGLMYLSFISFALNPPNTITQRI